MLTIQLYPFSFLNMNSKNTRWCKTRLSVLVLNTLSPFHTSLGNTVKKIVAYLFVDNFSAVSCSLTLYNSRYRTNLSVFYYLWSETHGFRCLLQMGQTPLHVSAGYNKAEIVKFLLAWQGPEKVELEAKNMVGVYHSLLAVVFLTKLNRGAQLLFRAKPSQLSAVWRDPIAYGSKERLQ